MDRFMQMAIEEAQATKAEGGSPFGAVLIREGEVIGIGRNLMIQNNDPLSHGEMEAIKPPACRRATPIPCYTPAPSLA